MNSASGANIAGHSGSLSYSIGQILTSNVSGTTGFIFSGVQLPYEITILVGMDDMRFNLKSEIFPNPSTEFLNLKVDELALQNSSSIFYQLCGSTGKILESSKINSNETKNSNRTLLCRNLPIKINARKQRD